MSKLNITLLNNIINKWVPGITYPYYIERKSHRRIKIYYDTKKLIIYPGNINTTIEKRIIAHNKSRIDLLINLMVNNKYFDYKKHGIWVPVKGIYQVIKKNKEFKKIPLK